jgi:predicted TIM-barrel fold metal-dependent hydrolase
MPSQPNKGLSAQSASLHIADLSGDKFEPLPFKPISADSHVTEPPNCYVDNIEAKYKDTAPRVVRAADGGDYFVLDGMSAQVNMGGCAAAGIDVRKTGRPINTLTFDDIHRGGFDGKARLADQNRDGVGGEIIYPSVGMLVCNHPNPDYKKACMDAYNRWLQGFQSTAPERIFGVGQIAIRSVKEAVSELEKLKAMGFRGVMMPGEPCTEVDYDDDSFDPLWEAAVALEMPLSFHILTAKSDVKTFSGQAPHRGKAKANYLHALIRVNQDIIGMFIWGRVFEKHPKLKLVCVEADAGWAPHFMYRMDHFYHRKLAHKQMEMDKLSKLPSDYFRENIYLTFQDDFIAFSTADLMNPERLLWASDFPHGDSTWPWSQQLIARQTTNLSDEHKRLILRDNVAELYKLPVN